MDIETWSEKSHELTIKEYLDISVIRWREA